MFGEIEGLDREREALFGRAGEEERMARVAMGEERVLEDIALRGARRKAGGGTDAFHVEDDGGDFGVVAQADEFAHERDAGAGRGGHGAGTRPGGTESHADGSD